MELILLVAVVAVVVVVVTGPDEFELLFVTGGLGTCVFV